MQNRERPADIMPGITDIKEMVFLVLLSVCVSMGYNRLSDNGLALVGQWDTSQGVISARSKHSVVDASREINSLVEMKQIVEEKQCVVADVRPDAAYEKGHIPGALSFPLSRFDQVIGTFIEQIAPESPVVLYCSGRECHESHAFADQIGQFGYTDVKVFSGGFDEWQQQGLPIEEGAGHDK